MYSIIIYFAQLAARSVYTWHFDVPSPFDMAWKGLAHHSHDNVLIWSVLKHKPPPTQQRVSESMVEAWVKFANGEEPWERFGKNQLWMVFSEEGPQLKTRDEDQGRGYEVWDRLYELGLVGKFSDLSDELCIRRSDLIKGRHVLMINKSRLLCASLLVGVM